MSDALDSVLARLERVGRGPRDGRCAPSSTTEDVPATGRPATTEDVTATGRPTTTEDVPATEDAATTGGAATPVVCVDGPAGAGKTTLAAELVAAVPGARCLHLDDLYEGWSGLATVGEGLAEVLAPLAEGRPGRYRRWDWHASRRAELVVLEPGPLLVVEGVGAGCWHQADVLVWVDAPAPLRQQRGLARDGEAFAPYWDQWAADEAGLFAREQPRERADLVVDGRDGSVSASR